MGSKFNYDVGISFLREDENLAIRLCNQLEHAYSYKTFIYPNRQREVAGTDGIEKFTRIFREESRVVIVLYREKWGKTNWTRIEEAAIKSRVLIKGFDFLLFIKLEQELAIPNWYPKTQIWFNCSQRYNIETLATIIDAHVQRNGGEPKAETLEEKIERNEKEIQWEADLKKYLNSEAAVRDSGHEFNELKTYLKARMTELMTYAGNKHFLILTDSLREIKISSFGLLLNITWNWIASNTLIDSELICSIVDAVNDPYIRKHPKVFEKHEYDFSKDQTGNFGWVEKNDDALHSSKELVDDWLEKLFEFGYKTR